MKKIFLSILASTLALSAFAAGEYGPNYPQSGVLNFPPGTVANGVSNMFAYPFTQVPVMVFYATTTNAAPITNNFVTTTNFGVQSASTNNAIISWTAYIGYPRIQVGQVVTVANTTTNVLFATPYAQIPTITLGQGGTNVQFQAAVTAITLTNFSLLSNVASTNQWQAIGTALTPGLNNVTQ